MAASRPTCPTGVTPYRENHSLRHARSAALRRAGRMCQECGRGKGLDALVRLLFPATDWWDWQAEHPVTAALWWEFCSVRLEVHHRQPLWGNPPVGCRNHLDPDENGGGGLAVLCAPCHRRETDRWASVHAAFLRGFGIDIASLDDEMSTALPAAS